MWKLAFAVFHAGFAQLITEKRKANVQAAKANTEWALHVPSKTVHSRKKPWRILRREQNLREVEKKQGDGQKGRLSAKLPEG
jgi:hypothetical protein